MNPLLTLPHLPVVLFLGGALGLAVTSLGISRRARNGLALATCLAAGVPTYLMRPNLPLDVVFSDWLVGFTLLGSLVYHVDVLSWAFAFGLLILITAMVAGWATGEGAQDRTRLIPCLFVMAAATYSTLFSGNLLTLLLSSALLMAGALALLAVTGQSARSMCHLAVIWGVGVFSLLWAVWQVGWGDGGRWSVLEHSQTATLAVYVLSWIALGAYPLHLWIPRIANDSAEVLLPFHVVPPMAGLYLLARLSVVQASLPFRELWVALGAIALLLGAELAWSEQNRLRSLCYVGTALSGGVMLATALTLPHSLGLALTWALCLPFPLLAVCLVPSRAGEEAPEWHDWLLATVTGLGGACLVGVPPTAGFIAWSQLHNSVLSTEDIVTMTLLFAVASLSSVLIAAAFFSSWLHPAPVSRLRGDVARAAVGAFLVIPPLIGGLVPNLIVPYVAGPGWIGWSVQVYSSISIGIWITILLCVSIGYVLNLWPPATLAKSYPRWLVVVRICSLDWVCDATERAGTWLTGAVDTVSEVVHGDHYLLWAFLAVAIFLWLYLAS